MALIDITPDDHVFVLDSPGAPLARCRVIEVERSTAVVERFGYPPTRINRFRIYAVAFGVGACKTCGCPTAWPYRRRNAHGEIVEGCVDAVHDVIPTDVTGHESDRAWHDRPVAIRVRIESAARLAALLNDDRGAVRVAKKEGQS